MTGAGPLGAPGAAHNNAAELAERGAPPSGRIAGGFVTTQSRTYLTRRLDIVR